MPNQKKEYLYTLQIFRAICVFLVIIHHALPSIKYFNQSEIFGYYYLHEITNYAVDFFLLISGFIINYTFHFSTNKRTVSEYYMSRFLRIYIPYLPIALLLFILYTYLPTLSEGNREISAFTTFTLLPHGKPALSVAWSLVYEVMFYILFAICIVNKKVWNIFISIWFILIIVYNYIYPIEYGYFIFLNPFCINFIIGYLLSLIVIHKIHINKSLLYLLLAISISVYFYFLINNINYFFHDKKLIITFVHLIIAYLGIVYYNKNYKSLKFLFFIGSISYSIYLIHNPLLSFLVRITPKKLSQFEILILIFTIIIISVFTAYVYCNFFEKKMVTKLKKHLKNE